MHVGSGCHQQGKLRHLHCSLLIQMVIGTNEEGVHSHQSQTWTPGYGHFLPERLEDPSEDRDGGVLLGRKVWAELRSSVVLGGRGLRFMGTEAAVFAHHCTFQMTIQQVSVHLSGFLPTELGAGLPVLLRLGRRRQLQYPVLLDHFFSLTQRYPLGSGLCAFLLAG